MNLTNPNRYQLQIKSPAGDSFDATDLPSGRIILVVHGLYPRLATAYGLGPAWRGPTSPKGNELVCTEASPRGIERAVPFRRKSLPSAATNCAFSASPVTNWVTKHVRVRKSSFEGLRTIIAGGTVPGTSLLWGLIRAAASRQIASTQAGLRSVCKPYFPEVPITKRRQFNILMAQQGAELGERALQEIRNTQLLSTNVIFISQVDRVATNLAEAAQRPALK